MELHGSIEQNLASAVRSAKRLRGRRVYKETVEHWLHVLAVAGRELSAPSSVLDRQELHQLVSELEAELAYRERWDAR